MEVSRVRLTPGGRGIFGRADAFPHVALPIRAAQVVKSQNKRGTRMFSLRYRPSRASALLNRKLPLRSSDGFASRALESGTSWEARKVVVGRDAFSGGSWRKMLIALMRTPRRRGRNQPRPKSRGDAQLPVISRRAPPSCVAARCFFSFKTKTSVGKIQASNPRKRIFMRA